MTIEISKDVCRDVGKALELEWLDTNGAGSYSSSTVLGCHTRKYHGLLVARLDHPPGKYVLLSKLEDSLFTKQEEIFMTCHQYRGAFFPKDNHLQEFAQDKTTAFKYAFPKAEAIKETALVTGENTLLVKYTCTQNQMGGRLRIKPLIAFRNFHDLSRENISLRVRTFPAKNGFLISPYDGMPTLYVQFKGEVEFFPSPMWYRNFEYPIERSRGFEDNEDLFCPGLLEAAFDKGMEVIVSVSVSEQNKDLGAMWRQEIDRRGERIRKAQGTALQKSLARAADQFVTTWSGRRSITAGYHWFREWGRDAMISLPGLLLTDGPNDAYLDVLKSFAAHQRDGIIPNFMGDSVDANAYNSADASLWFGWAVQQYAMHTGDLGRIEGSILQAMERTFESYRNGTKHGIKMSENGLVAAGSPLEQVTWMDAVVEGRPATPRFGCAVEINALWYNFTAFLAELDRKIGTKLGDEPQRLLPRIESSFNQAFWLPDRGYLADVYRETGRDTALRPNQIFAVSLPYSPLSADRAKSAMAKVRAELRTEVGLRTLARSESGYRPRYEGGPAERDGAYHNGTVWSWLVGHYGEGLLKVWPDKAEAVRELEDILNNFQKHIGEAGLGSISEIFDADPPHRPNGCISQAWSVAEVLRLSRIVEKEKAKLRDHTRSQESCRCES